MTQFITWPYVLRKGHSDNPAEGACAMDAVNWLVHGKHGDAPECACPLIAHFVIGGNDAMPDDVRQRLLSYLPRIAGSRSKEHQAARLRVLVLGAVRVFAPRALDAAGLLEHAARLRNLPDDASYSGLRAAAASAAASAAWVAAWAVARAEVAVARAEVAAAWAAAEAAEAAAMAAKAVATAVARAAAAAGAWDDYFLVLDAVLAAGPQGEPWSTDAIEHGAGLYAQAGGLLVEV